jgi:hypothetical protein
MTIHECYLVYGFKVTREKYAAIHGYGRELLNDERFVRHAMNISGGFYSGYGETDPAKQLDNITECFDDIVEDIMVTGIDCINDGEPHWDECGFTVSKSFIIDGVPFVTRSGTHDDETLHDCYIVGVDIEQIDVSKHGRPTVEHICTKYVTNQHRDTIALQMAAIRLTAIGIPFDIVTLITKYITSPDYEYECGLLLTDPKWKTIITSDLNEDLKPQLYVLTDDCSCCS